MNANDCHLPSIPIFYQLIKEDSSSPFPFLLDPHTGVIKVIHELDREIKSFYKFHINLFIYRHMIIMKIIKYSLFIFIQPMVMPL